MTGNGWIDAVNDHGALAVAAKLGLEVRGSMFGPCPVCDAEWRSSKERRRPACGTRGPDAKGWECHACHTTGDAFNLVELKMGGRPTTGKGWAELRAECAALGLCPPDAPGGRWTPPGRRGYPSPLP